ncbi:MAG: hypothetical protein IKA36_02795 [Clostridia bacterium]|nr:hypothetical protein [Clostridia bacterium]
MRTKKKIEIDKFDKFFEESNDLCEKFYNVSMNNSLTNSIGIRVAEFPFNRESELQYKLNTQDLNITAVKGLTYFKQYFPISGNTQYRVLLYGDDKKVYINQLFYESGDMDWLYGLTFNSSPITLAYKKNDADAIILSSTDKMVVWRTDYAPYTIENVPIITSMCMNEGVLYCTIKEPAFKIWYATDLDVENIGQINNNSGYISLEDDLGYARKVVTFDESVYVFRDYGITKITNYKRENSISQIYKSNTMIYCDTVSVCGNLIFFMTKDGVYSFNGVKVSKTNIDLSDLLTGDMSNASASSLGSKYFVALKLNFNDDKEILCEMTEHKNNAVLVVDITDESYQIIRGIDIQSFLPVKTDKFEKMLVTFNSIYETEVGEIVQDSVCFDRELSKYWRIDNLTKDMNTKLFTSLKIDSKEDTQININFDNKKLTFYTYQNGVNKFNFKVCSSDCSVEVLSEKDLKVDKIEIDYYEY